MDMYVVVVLADEVMNSPPPFVNSMLVYISTHSITTPPIHILGGPALWDSHLSFPRIAAVLCTLQVYWNNAVPAMYIYIVIISVAI